MKLLHLKYKMHKLVNLVFYLIIFGIGFLLGFSAEKINFNKLISQFLFIDNVNAYSINDEVDEELIFTLLSRNETFNIDEYPYIYVLYGKRNSAYNSEYSPQYRIYAFSKDFFQKTELIDDNHTYQSKEGNITHFYFYYENSSDIGNVSFKEPTSFSFLTPPSSSNNWLDSSMNYFTNFNFKELTSEENLNYNKLNFSKFMSSTCDNCNNGGSNNNTGNDNDNTGGDNTDEDIEVEVVNSGFYEFAQKIFGEVSEENKFIYDFITFSLVVSCFTLFILIVGYIFNKFFGG